MKISELCKMVEDSIRTGKYPFENQQQKHFAELVQIINKSDSENLKKERHKNRSQNTRSIYREQLCTWYAAFARCN